MNRIWGLDLLRAIAIISVLLFHALGFIKDPHPAFHAFAARGWSGVDLFFVLSGFLVGGQLITFSEERSRFEQYREFLIKRWTRTLPLYYLVLFFYVAVKPLVFKAPFVGFDWKWFFFLQNLGPIRDFGQTWSLAVEEQFYFLFPLAVLLFGRLRPIFWLTPLFLSAGYRWYYSSELAASGKLAAMSAEEYLWTFRFPLYSILDSITVGVFLARTHGNWSRWNRKLKLALAGLGGIVATLGLALIPEVPKTPAEILLLYLSLGLGFGLLLIYFESVKATPRFGGSVQQVALWSYSAYLIHPIFVRFFDRYLSGFSSFLTIPVYLGLILVISKLSYDWIELPGLKLRKRLLPRREAEAGKEILFKVR